MMTDALARNPSPSIKISGQLAALALLSMTACTDDPQLLEPAAGSGSTTQSTGAAGTWNVDPTAPTSWTAGGQWTSSGSSSSFGSTSGLDTGSTTLDASSGTGTTITSTGEGGLETGGSAGTSETTSSAETTASSSGGTTGSEDADDTGTGDLDSGTQDTDASSEDSSTNTTGNATTGTSTSGSTTDDGTSTGDLQTYCADRDLDGFGDPQECDDFDPDSIPETWVDNADDCDDRHGRTAPGAASEELDPGLCRRDEDDDGWGDANPPSGVTPGTDCDDTNEFLGPCPTMPLAVTLTDRVVIAPGEATVLRPQASGGSGHRTWAWSPPTALSAVNVQSPTAQPDATTVYRVNVTDRGTMEQVSASVIVEVSTDTDDTNFQRFREFSLRPEIHWPEIFDPFWEVEAGGARVCQTSNSTPSAFVSPEEFGDGLIQLSFFSNDASDDDWLGLVWRMQPSDDPSEPQRYYLLTWRKDGANSSHAECGQIAPQPGLHVWRIDETLGDGKLEKCEQIFGTVMPADNRQLLVRPSDWGGSEGAGVGGWQPGAKYEIAIDIFEGFTAITLLSPDIPGWQATTEFTDHSFSRGRVGAYVFSQDNICFEDLLLFQR